MMGHVGYFNVGLQYEPNQLTRTEMNLYASRDSTINRTKKHAVMAKLAFFTIDQIGTRFLFPFVPSSSSDAMALFRFIFSRKSYCAHTIYNIILYTLFLSFSRDNHTYNPTYRPVDQPHRLNSVKPTEFSRSFSPIFRRTDTITTQAPLFYQNLRNTR